MRVSRPHPVARSPLAPIAPPGRRIGRAAAVLGLALAVAACGGEPEVSTPRTIATIGAGSAAATPDIAHINVGVGAQGETASQALSANAEQMAEVYRAIEALGIERRDVVTADISLQPLYESTTDENGRRRQRLVGYHASNTVRLTMRDVGEVGAALDALTTAGSTTISGLSFDVSDSESLRDAARANAIADARRKADLFADEADIDVGAVMSITEHGAREASPFAGGVARALEATTPMSPGETEITATVTVVWAIDD